jgi:hypothetical protein
MEGVWLVVKVSREQVFGVQGEYAALLVVRRGSLVLILGAGEWGGSEMADWVRDGISGALALKAFAA